MKLMGDTRTSNTRNTLNLKVPESAALSQDSGLQFDRARKKSIKKNRTSTNGTLTASGPARLPGV